MAPTHARLLLLAVPFLLAAAPLPIPCAPTAIPREQLPAPLDLSGRPLPRQGLLSHATSAGRGCAEPGPATQPSSGLHDPRSDVLHGLPVLDAMPPLPPRPGN
ncbi:MAG: hypothetical protein EXR07_03525 [Acetobacteraceae bacterium]|nr:hypothetical protein [Acetobacteraceae bacterium]